MTSTELLTRMIKAGAGEVPADVVVKNVRLLDVITGAITHTDVAIVADRIVGTHGYYNGDRLIEGDNRFAVPGFIDTHLHIESSLVTPFEFDRCVLPHGVTTVICDPHEIANVLGADGIRETMAAYIDLKPHMDVVTHHTTVAGDFAMTRSQWLITGTDKHGKRTEVHHHGMEVHRRLPDGSWVFFMDHPFGADPSWAVPKPPHTE